jgi:isoquinoline 1-oxidoreductase subunit beta
MKRRTWLIGTGLVGGALAVGVGWLAQTVSRNRAYRLQLSGARSQDLSFGAWLAIGRDGRVTVAVPHQEMGQGIFTTIPMLVAEELGVSPQALSAIPAPLAPVYANVQVLVDALPFSAEDEGVLARSARQGAQLLGELAGVQATGGSTSIRNTWRAARTAGAAARQMLTQAASSAWGVPAARIELREGLLIHPDGRSAPIGQFVEAAAQLAPPEKPALKAASAFRLIGRGMPRLDTASKIDGQAVFGIDLQFEGMRYAAIRHCPVFGGRLSDARLPQGVVLPGEPQLVKGPDFIAVVATSWWLAEQAIARVHADWQVPGRSLQTAPSSSAVASELARTAQGLSASADFRDYEKSGDPQALLAAGAPEGGALLSADYQVPYLAHATMEPLNCTARVQDGRCEIWAGQQAPTLAKWLGGSLAGIPEKATTVQVPLLGGGFGRRAELDFVQQAVFIASRFPGVAVKTLWSREEDMRHDVYRPAAAARLQAVLGRDGAIRSLVAQVASPSVNRQFMQRLSPKLAASLPDKTNVEGLIHSPYALGERQIRHAQVDSPVPVGFWRSVGHSFNAFFIESFIDECAARARVDPYRYRCRLLDAQPLDSPLSGAARRARAVLDAVARASQWEQWEARAAQRGAGLPPPATDVVPGVRQGLGMAYAASFGSHVAQVVQVEVASDGVIRIPQVWVAVDCGLAMDPAIVKAQLAGAVIFGLTAALYGRIDVEKGSVVQGNFNDYRMLAMDDSPNVDVVIVDSGHAPGGIGEVGVPPAAPALVNAVFAATGDRRRTLPLAA